MKRAIGRADLARLLSSFPRASDADVAIHAASLGFERAPVSRRGKSALEEALRDLAEDEPEAPADGDAAADATVPAGHSAMVTRPGPPAPVPIWMPVKVTYRENVPPVPAGRQGLTEAQFQSPSLRGPRPSMPALCRWSRLWPALHRALAAPVPTSQVDERALCRWIGEARTFGRLPRRTRLRWPARLIVSADRSARLTPFWADQTDVCRRLRRLLGHQQVSVDLDGAGAVAASGADALLVLGDLGFMGPRDERARWGQAARRLAAAGVRTAALVLAPPDRWERALAARFGAIAWEAPSRRADTARADPRGRGATERRQQRAERLLRLVSPAVRIEPGLLRAVRRLLPAGEVDAGTEHDVWNHPDVVGSHSVAAWLRPEAASPRRQAFVQTEPEELQRQVAAVVRGRHDHLPPEVWGQEALALMGAGAERLLDRVDRDAVVEFVASLPHTMAPGAAPPATQRALGAWFRDVAMRLPPGSFEHPVVGESLGRMWWWAHDRMPEAPVPAGVHPGLRPPPPVEEPPPPPRSFQVFHVGGELRFVPAGRASTSAGASASAAAGTIGSRPSPVVSLSASDPVVTIAGRPVIDLDPGPTSAELWPGHASKGGIVLGTDRMEVRLAALKRPSWARAFGRDPLGAWADIEACGVRARLRYIPPGRFLMGSPEDEVGRWKNEGPQHQVTISSGFWLGDTPCTQALWQAVTGTNPSRFKDRPDSAQRPVEKVSHGDCVQFCERLNKLDPELKLRLPTEAEWEYACRAGTITSTYAGDLQDSTKDAALDDIAIYGANSGDETHAVGEKQKRLCNDWGLFDMLGNVYEWCRDWSGEYTGRALVDPSGPDSGTLRVLRGGSWASDARRVRAADRFGYLPGRRDGNFGFRLARGQGESGQQEEEGRSESAAEPPYERRPATKGWSLRRIFSRQKKSEER